MDEGPPDRARRDDCGGRLTVEHARLPDAGEADRMKAFWRERLTALKSQLEEVADDA